MTRGRRRRLALFAALLVHAVVFVVVRERDLVRERPRPSTDAVLLELRATLTTPTTPTTPTTTATPTVLAEPPPAPPKTRPTTTPATTTTPAATTTTTAPTEAAPPATETVAADGVVVDRSPRGSHAPGSLLEAIRGSDDRGPQPSRAALEGALDYAPPADVDAGKGGARLAAAKAERSLRADIAFHDVTVGMANDWFREVRNATERAFRPLPADLDNPSEVTRQAIVGNFVRDPSAWDDEARRALGPMLAATSLHSQDRAKRQALGNSAALAAPTSTAVRKSTLDDLLTRKEAGLSVRYAFEVDVHHAEDGALTAIDIVRGGVAQRGLVEKVRVAIEDALATAATAPTSMTKGLPFRSRWVLAATWFIDPPSCLLAPSDSLGMAPNTFQLGCGGTFDFDGNAATSLDVQQRVVAELVRVQLLPPR